MPFHEGKPKPPYAAKGGPHMSRGGPPMPPRPMGPPIIDGRKGGLRRPVLSQSTYAEGEDWGATPSRPAPRRGGYGNASAPAAGPVARKFFYQPMPFHEGKPKPPYAAKGGSHMARGGPPMPPRPMGPSIIGGRKGGPRRPVLAQSTYAEGEDWGAAPSRPAPRRGGYGNASAPAAGPVARKMFVFTCSQCGQSLKKNEVATHCNFRCRGDDYKQHIRSITKAKKHGGKDKLKPISNKGNQEEAQWITRIKDTLSSKKLYGPLARLLQHVIQYSTFPRSKSKFQDFIENSTHERNQAVIDEAWSIFKKSIKIMFSFACSQCGQFLKKNQVETHCQFRCRNVQNLCCLYCGKHFRRDDYNQHILCITKAKTYGGKDFKPKPVSNKGEQRQDQWRRDDYKQHNPSITKAKKRGVKDFKPKPISNQGEQRQEQLNTLIKDTLSSKTLYGPSARLLRCITKYRNIPRKKYKFQNFIIRTFKTHDQKLIDETWGILEKIIKKCPDARATNAVNGTRVSVKRSADVSLDKSL